MPTPRRMLILRTLAVVAVLLPAAGGTLAAQTWPYIGGDAAHTRYTPASQVDASNFESLQTAWIWRGDNFGPRPEATSRSTPIYVDGLLYTVAGSRRTVVAIDPATGETIWTFREPHTTRWETGSPSRKARSCRM